jgi:hypothetical protein
MKEYSPKYRKNNPEKIAKQDKSRARRRYGLSQEQFDKMFQEQNGVCAICFRPERSTKNGKLKALSIDHNHSTGKVRKLLCDGCNHALGYAEENTIILASMIEYIRRES